MSVKQKQYGREYYEGIIGKTANDSQRNRNRLQAILKIKKEGTLLEIGSGKGEFLRLAEAHFKIEGIDISEYAVDSSKNILNGRIRRENIERYNLLKNRYDVIAVFNVLEHLDKPNQVINKIYYALREKGLFIGSVPHNATLVGRIFTALTRIFDPTHISTYPPDRWNSLFKATGFQEIDYFGEIVLGKDFNVYLRNRLWKIFSLNLVFECVK